MSDLAGAKPSQNLAAAPLFAPTGSVPSTPAKMIFIADPVVNQGDVPCCVALALTAAFQVVRASPPLSPLFNYFRSRPDPAVIEDVELFDAFRSAQFDGLCRRDLHDFAFSEDGALREPSGTAVADAATRKLGLTPIGTPAFGRVPVAVDRWQSAIAMSLPVVFGFFMSPEYDDILAGTTVALRAPSSLHQTGHACLAIGFDDDDKNFVIRDSRGTGIGVAGTWFLPYDLVEQAFIFESWVIR